MARNHSIKVTTKTKTTITKTTKTRITTTKITKTKVTKVKATTKAALTAPACITKTKPTPKKKKELAPETQSPFDNDHLEKTMKANYAELRKAVKADWDNGYVEQGEMIIEMVLLLNKWQNQIFLVAIGPGKHLEEAFTTMYHVGTWLNKLKRNKLNTCTEWYDLDLEECNVTNEAGEQIYEGRPERMQTLMWRDLALRAIVAEDKRIFNAIVGHCYDGETFDEESLYLVFCIDGEEADDDLFPLHDEWYADDEDMQNAVQVFKKMLDIK